MARKISAPLLWIALLTGIFGLVISLDVMAADDDKPDPTEDAAEVLDGFVRTGEMRRCLGLRQIREIRPLDDHYFLVRVGVADFYLNQVRGRCRGAARGSNRIQYTTSLAQLCRNELINVVDNLSNIFVGSCSLGSFERLEKKPEPEEN